MHFSALLLFGISLCIPAAQAAVMLSTTFRDVPAAHPLYEAIERLTEEGIVKGYFDNTYRPDNFLNRAEFVKIVAAATVAPKDIANCLRSHPNLPKDVRATEWYAPYVCAAKVTGIASGYDDDTFRPEQHIVFTETAKVLTVAYDLKYEQNQKPWYRGYVTALGEHQAIPLNINALDKKITRGEMADMLDRLRHPSGKASLTYEDFDPFWSVYGNDSVGLRFSYPRRSGLPQMDKDGSTLDTVLPIARQSLWRVNIGAQVDCTGDALCFPYVWHLDGIARDEAEEAAADIRAGTEGIELVQETTNDNGIAVLIFTEKGICTHKKALVSTQNGAALLTWECGIDDADPLSDDSFHYIAKSVRFFGDAPAIPAKSSTSSSAQSQQLSSAASSTQQSDGGPTFILE